MRGHPIPLCFFHHFSNNFSLIVTAITDISSLLRYLVLYTYCTSEQCASLHISGVIMSHSLPALQENALRAADAFCKRYIPPPKKKQRRVPRLKQSATLQRQDRRKNTDTFYQPRDHKASPFFKVVRDNFDKFEEVYPEQYQERYGYWRPIIRTSIDKFLKCGDLKEGFARVRCPDCKEEFFVAFSCRQRACAALPVIRSAP